MNLNEIAGPSVMCGEHTLSSIQYDAARWREAEKSFRSKPRVVVECEFCNQIFRRAEHMRWYKKVQQNKSETLAGKLRKH